MFLEEIPASETRGESAHQHIDFLFLARPRDPAQALVLAEAEGGELKWFTRAEVAALNTQTEVFGNVREAILGFLP